MYFSRIRLDLASAGTDEWNTFIGGSTYGVHQIVWRLFSEDADAARDFLYRVEVGNGLPFLYVVSKRPPQPIGKLTRIETKPYEPQLAVGERLMFSLRANPVVTKKDPVSGKRIRHDVVMNAKHALPRPFKANMQISSSEIEHQAGIQWLSDRAQRLGFAFDPSTMRVSQYQQHALKKPAPKSKIRFSSLDYNGELTVTDPERLCRVLVEGIGPAKAFGCGLMLLRRR